MLKILSQKLCNVVESGVMAAYDDLVEEIYAAGLTPVEVWKEAKPLIIKSRNQEKKINKQVEDYYENIRKNREHQQSIVEVPFRSWEDQQNI